MGRYLNHSDQGERLRAVLEIAPTEPQAVVPRTPKSVFWRLEPNKVAQLPVAMSEAFASTNWLRSSRSTRAPSLATWTELA
jgi:hypothetical protein